MPTTAEETPGIGPLGSPSSTFGPTNCRAISRATVGPAASHAPARVSALLLGLLLENCVQSLQVRVNPRIYVSGIVDGDIGCSRRSDGGQALGVQPPGIDLPGSAACPATWHDYHV